MICITETAALAVKMAAATSGIMSRGTLIKQELTPQLEKELLRQYEPLKFIKGRIDNEETRFIWLESPIIRPKPASDYKEYEKAADKEAFLPKKREYVVTSGCEDTEAFLEKALTSDQNILDACATPQGHRIFTWLYDKYDLYKKADCKRILINLEDGSLTETFRDKKNTLSKGETQKQILSELAVEEIFWLLTVNLSLLYGSISGQSLQIDVKKIAILYLLKESLTHGDLITITSKEYSLLYKEQDVKEILITLKNKGFINTGSYITLTADGETFLQSFDKLESYVQCDYLNKIAKEVYDTPNDTYTTDIENIKNNYKDEINEITNAIYRGGLVTLPCPLCHGKVHDKGKTYKCDACNFEVKKKLYGKILTKEIFEYLLTNKSTPIYKGSDNIFSKLILEPDGSITSSSITDYCCPVCGNRLFMEKYGEKMYCKEDSFSLPLVYATHRLTKSELATLLSTGVSPLLKGCVKDDGTVFYGGIKLQGAKITFLEVV